MNAGAGRAAAEKRSVHRGEPVLSRRPRLFGITPTRAATTNSRRWRAIEGHDAVVETEPRLRQAAFITTGQGSPPPPHRVEPEVAHGTAGKRREALDRRHRSEIGCLPQLLDRCSPAGRAIDKDRVVRTRQCERVGADERIAGRPFAAFHALEEEGVATVDARRE